jgi:hypothetical protein
MKYILMACIAIVVFSCNKAENKAPIGEVSKQLDDIKATGNGTSDSTAAADFSTTPITPMVLQAGSPDWDKKIIKTANLSLELQEYNSYNAEVHQSLRNYGAYIAQEQQLQSEGQVSNQVTIKVPVDQFENLVNFFATADKNVKVLDKQITSEDVSTEIVDTKSRVETKKKLRDKYFELMSQSKKMDDVIRVQNEISTITEDIEAASSRVMYLSHQSAYSTINLKYYQVLDAAKIDDSAPSFFTSFTNAFKQGASIIINLVLFFVNIWPLVIGALAGWYVFRKKILKPKPQQVS